MRPAQTLWSVAQTRLERWQLVERVGWLVATAKGAEVGWLATVGDDTTDGCACPAVQAVTAMTIRLLDKANRTIARLENDASPANLFMIHPLS